MNLHNHLNKTIFAINTLTIRIPNEYRIIQKP
jgi:hypothetical protein